MGRTLSKSKCAYCGEEFFSPVYRNRVCCSRKCANSLRSVASLKRIDDYGEKRCGSCGEYLSVSEFGFSSSTPSRLKSWCKKCTSIYTKENKPSTEATESYKDKTLIRKYGITLDDYNLMLEDQGGVCAICGLAEYAKSNSGNDGTKLMAVDHNHESGTVRGLLCARCNMAIGLLMDDRRVLLSAIEYLEDSCFLEVV